MAVDAARGAGAGGRCCPVQETTAARHPNASASGRFRSGKLKLPQWWVEDSAFRLWA